MDSQPLAIAGVVAVLLAGGVGFALADTGGAPTAENATVTVSADATVERSPDRATVTVAAVGRGDTASAARDELSGDADDIESALEDEGANVTSSRFSIQPEYEYTSEGTEQVGYVAVHTIEAETSDVDGVGSLVDAAVDSGADRVDGISYGLSEETRAAAGDEARTQAMEDARANADTLATAEDRSVGDALTIQTGRESEGPVYAEAAYAADTGGSTSISPGPLTVRTTVTVTYELE
jgi:uncharacterized protein YggE